MRYQRQPRSPLRSNFNAGTSSRRYEENSETCSRLVFGSPGYYRTFLTIPSGNPFHFAGYDYSGTGNTFIPQAVI